ncbi:MAG: HD domain-containing protein [Patescibacteria group bacterium]
MNKHEKVTQLVAQAYASSTDALAAWMWDNHVQVVAKKAETLCHVHNANTDIAVAGALLHDFGDAFLNRHDPQFEAVTDKESRAVLQKAGYTENEIETVMNVVIKPHECRGDELPQTLEGKILTTADAYAHFMTDFYPQFCWMHIPENKTYAEFISWVQEKLERDYTIKIFFEDVRQEVASRYQALKEIFT